MDIKRSISEIKSSIIGEITNTDVIRTLDKIDSERVAVNIDNIIKTIRQSVNPLGYIRGLYLDQVARILEIMIERLVMNHPNILGKRVNIYRSIVKWLSPSIVVTREFSTDIQSDMVTNYDVNTLQIADNETIEDFERKYLSGKGDLVYIHNIYVTPRKSEAQSGSNKNMIKSAGRLRLFIPREGEWRDMNQAEYIAYNKAFQIRNLKLKKYVKDKAIKIGNELEDSDAKMYMVVTMGQYRIASAFEHDDKRLNKDGAVVSDKREQGMRDIIAPYLTDPVIFDKYNDENPNGRDSLTKFIKWIFITYLDATICLSGPFPSFPKDLTSYPEFMKVMTNVEYQGVEIEEIGGRAPKDLHPLRQEMFHIALETIRTRKTIIETISEFQHIEEPMYQDILNKGLSLPIGLPQYIDCFIK